MASIKKRQNGRWRARYRDAAGREHAKHFPRKIDAQRWLDTVTASLVRGDYVDPKAGKLTFREYYRNWRVSQVWATGTRRAMDLAAGSVTFADLPLGSLKRSHVEAWIKGMSTTSTTRKKPLAASTIHTRTNNVRSVLRAAVEDRVITRDPSKGVTLPRRRRAESAMVIPTTGEVGAILRVADRRFTAYVGLCAFAGLRLGEAAAVQVGDVDFLRRTLTLSRQVQRENGGGIEIRPPKYGSERVLFLAPALVELLAAHVEKNCPGDEPDRWMFVGLGTEPPHQNTIGHWWRTTLKAAGLSGIKLHDLRHYYASGLIAAGCDVVTVQRALGHSRATTTLNTYSHLWPTAEDRTRNAAQEMLNEAVGDTADFLRTTQGP
jgi:integrase